MNFEEYETRAAHTDQFQSEPTSAQRFARNLIVCGNEVLEAIERYPKDRERLRGKLGDVLWYIARTGARSGYSLDDIAAANLMDVEPRFGNNPYKGILFDAAHPAKERLPRVLQVKFEDLGNGKTRISTPLAFGEGEDMQLGDVIDDNAHSGDGYRYHDVFHLAYATILGWSPILRALLKRKRRSDPTTDRVEDGARARDIEESVTSYIFNVAKEEGFFEGAAEVPFSILREVARMVQALEVRYRGFNEWQTAILAGCEGFRALKANRGGYVVLDLNKRAMTYHATLA